jgi:hypothetical protein
MLAHRPGMTRLALEIFSPILLTGYLPLLSKRHLPTLSMSLPRARTSLECVA